jgi:hypothetical protein
MVTNKEKTQITSLSTFTSVDIQNAGNTVISSTPTAVGTSSTLTTRGIPKTTDTSAQTSASQACAG